MSRHPGFLRPGCGQNFIELAENLTQLGLYAALDRMASAARNSRDDGFEDSSGVNHRAAKWKARTRE
jgi:hypothetical protein